MEDAQREMSLNEWCKKLPESHKARKELKALRLRVVESGLLLKECIECKDRHIDMELRDIIKKHLNL